jgi:tetratricopeptide (TPR) repeat protein
MKSSSAMTDNVVALLDARFRERREKFVADSASQIGPYHLAASVLHVFDPSSLRPYGRSPGSQGVIDAVFADSVLAVGWRQQRLRSLKPQIRGLALDQLGDRETMQKALKANRQRVLTPLQELFESWLSGSRLSPDRMKYSELELLRQLYEWNLDRFGGLPRRERFETARMKRASVSIFEHLVDENFVGREEELQSLRDHVGVVSPSRWSKVRRFVARGRTPPFILTGPGGIGKTALIGKFLLEHVESAKRGWFPFAYLPFDSDTLDVREPFTLLLAAGSQLESQVRSRGAASAETKRLDEAFGAFRSVVGHYRDERGILRQRASVAATQSSRLTRLSAAEAELYSRFSHLLDAISRAAGSAQEAEKVPVLLVFDTFEEVLYRTREELLGVWGMLDMIQKGFTELRVVIASRIEPRDSRVANLRLDMHKLGDLKENDSIKLLQLLGVEDFDIAKAVVGQIGCNPLSLRLAARVAEAEEINREGISDLKTKRFFMLHLGPELIRGQLYRRILDHIHDEDVRSLAHPGMVLRRVTPDLILNVLAPACELEGVNAEAAKDLFERLRAEHALVNIEADGSLRYREEVRRPMLELLSREKPEQVRRIHNLAVDFYSNESKVSRIPEATVRAEEIYHMLMLGADRRFLDRAWTEGVERYLASAIDEIPIMQRTWLASRMSIELPAEAYKMADVASWESIFGRKALEALRYEGPESVLSLLRERKERTPDSPLFAIEARALLAIDRSAEALARVNAALESYPPLGNLGRLAELLWIRSQAARRLKNETLAADSLSRLLDLSTSLASPLSRVQALTELTEVQTSLNSPALGSTRDALAESLKSLSEAETDTERSMVRLALVRLGAGYPSVVTRLIPFVIRDWIYIASERHFDVRAGLDAAEGALRAPNQPELTSLADRIVIHRDDPNAALTVMNELILGSRSDITVTDPYVIEAILHLLRVENASLAGATLAGLEAYRESWELVAAPELAV